jgi:hypothetical protein
MAGNRRISKPQIVFAVDSWHKLQAKFLEENHEDFSCFYCNALPPMNCSLLGFIAIAIYCYCHTLISQSLNICLITIQCCSDIWFHCFQAIANDWDLLLLPFIAIIFSCEINVNAFRCNHLLLLVTCHRGHT